MKLLSSAYRDTQTFERIGHELISSLAQHINEATKGDQETVIPYQNPNAEYDFWKNYLHNGNSDNLFETIMSHSIKLHSPKYMGHQICPPLPITALSQALSALLNNGMAVYEMGIASSSIEKLVVEELNKAVGYDLNSGGFLTSGGTLANLTAMLAARKVKGNKDVWTLGSDEKLGILVSEEAHYCIDRAARIMGLGDNGIIKVPVTKEYQIDINQLNNSYYEAKRNGINIIAIVGSAPSTSSGVYDDISALADFAEENNLWFHIDGAHGGAAIFSKKYKHLLKGVNRADSVVIDGHKMLLTPALTTALLFKDGNHSFATFHQKADYLLEASQDEDWYNLAKRTFECTKRMMSIHWFTILKVYGVSIFDEYVTYMYDLGTKFHHIIEARSNFESAFKPMSNIVCFRIRSSHWTEEKTAEINQLIRQKTIEIGEFYIVQTILKGTFHLRVTLMNPFTTESHLNRLLDHIEEIANEF